MHLQIFQNTQYVIYVRLELLLFLVSFNRNKECLQGTWQEAYDKCKSLGVRLCTKEEVEAGCLYSTVSIQRCTDLEFPKIAWTKTPGNYMDFIEYLYGTLYTGKSLLF